MGAAIPEGWQVGVWVLVALAGVAAGGGAAFFLMAARATGPTVGDARHSAEVLASRSTLLYDLGIAAGTGLMIAEAVTGSPGALLLAGGLSLVLLSAAGRLLILGARRRLRT